MKALALLAGLAACGGPSPLTLQYELTAGPDQLCIGNTGVPATTCAQITMQCDSVLSVRIFAPADPTAPYITLCKRVPTGTTKDLCSIAAIDLPPPATKVPEQSLEVDVAVYRLSDLDKDTAGNPICPSDVKYSATGFPLESTPTAAIGGRAFYHPGDPETVVELGCTDLPALEACSTTNTVTVTATVSDFDTLQSVDALTADRLSVSVGEPRPLGSSFVLNPTDVRLLSPTSSQPPAWDGDIDLKFNTGACLEVLDDSAQSTATLSCRPVSAGQNPIDITGVRLAKSSLDQILMALGRTAFPDTGLVVGIVLDSNGNPLANATVMATSTTVSGTIEYLSADRRNIIAGFTSSNGIFVSQDAPYGSTFSATYGQLQSAASFGGLVEGKVTIVVLQFDHPVGT